MCCVVIDYVLVFIFLLLVLLVCLFLLLLLGFRFVVVCISLMNVCVIFLGGMVLSCLLRWLVSVCVMVVSILIVVLLVFMCWVCCVFWNVWNVGMKCFCSGVLSRCMFFLIVVINVVWKCWWLFFSCW